MYRLDDQGNKTELIGQKKYDPRQRPWYKAAKKDQDLVWSPIYLFADPPILGITPAVPLKDSVTNKLQGVMAIDITLDEISKFLNSLKISDSGRAFIIEKSGNMVATSTNNSLVIQRTGENERLHYSASLDPLVKATAKKLAVELNNFQDIQETQQLIFKFRGDRHFVQATILDGYPGLDWLMVTVIPESDFGTYIRQNTYTTMLLSTVALIAAIFLGAIANQLIVNSVTQISDVAKAIAKGQVVGMEKSPNIKELAAVKESINMIASKLQDSNQNIQNLESKWSQRVEEATKNLKQANKRLNHLANIDSLTQIHNRYHFDLALEQLWQKALKHQTAIALILCDVDNFKLYNDTYGHLMGDQCLTKVAQAIKQSVNREQDVVARYGGEEIAVILPQTDQVGAVAVARKISDGIHQLNLVHRASTVSEQVTLSCGIACIIPDQQDSPLYLLQKADKALYQAKHLGKNRYVMA